MQFSPRRDDPVEESLREIVEGMGMSLVEYAASRVRGGVQVRVVVYKKDTVGIADCARVHRAAVPRLELAFAGQDLSLEVTSPGIDRVLKDANEFPLYVGRGVRCYRTDVSDWACGIVAEADSERVALRRGGETEEVPYSVVAKAKLDYSWEVEG